METFEAVSLFEGGTSSGSPYVLRVRYGSANAFFADYATKIARGHLWMRTNRPVRPGTAFDLRLDVPSLAFVLRCGGRVRSVRLVDAIRVDVKIEFTFDSPEARAGADRAVRELMERALGRRISAQLCSVERLPARPAAGLRRSLVEALG